MVLLDVRGSGLRTEHRAVVLKGDSVAREIQITRQKYGGPGLVQLILKLDPGIKSGDYTLKLVSSEGIWSNPLPLKIVR